MRIFIAVRHSLNPRLYYGSLWSGNFYPALRQLGHEIVESEVDLWPASQFMQVAKNFTHRELQERSHLTQRIIEEVKQAHQKKPLDLFLSYFYNAHFDSAGFEEIHNLGIPTINFYCNSIYQFDLVADIASKVTYSWYPEKNAKSLYLKVGGNPVWVQMGADPKVYHPVAGVTRQAKACFVGQRYADRHVLLANLLTSEVPVDIYGNGWGTPVINHNSSSDPPSEYLGRSTPPPGSWQSYVQVIHQNLQQRGIFGGIQKTLAQFYYRNSAKNTKGLLASAAKGFANDLSNTLAQYELVLNFSNVWCDGQPGSTLIPHVRLRDFEAPMCKSCYLTGYTDEIAEFYNLGKEIATYNDSDELIDKAKYYLSHPLEAEKLREAGYQRAIRCHTWEHRFQELFQKVNLK